MIARNSDHNRDRRAGNTFIEFSLVFGMFMAFAAGTFEMGRAIWTWSSVVHSVQEGARFAAMHGVENLAEAPAGAAVTTTATDAAIEHKVRSSAVGLDADQLNVQVIWSAGGIPGSDVTVTATYPFNMILGPFLADVTESMSISRSASSPVVN